MFRSSLAPIGAVNVLGIAFAGQIDTRRARIIAGGRF